MLGMLLIISACDRKNDKKETAKKYLEEQLKGSATREEIVSTNYMEFDMKVHEINDANFGEFISKGTTIVDFWATWCAPCRRQAPVIEELAGELGSKVRFGKMDVDRNKQTSEEMQILHLPTLVIFKDGKIMETYEGLQSKETVKNAIEKHL